MTRFYNLNHSGFFHSFHSSTQNIQFLPLVFLNNPLNISKIRKSFLFSKNEIINEAKFDASIERFFGNNLMISIVVILLAVVNLLPFFRALSHWRQVFCKWCKSGDCVLYDNIVKYLTTQSTFVELT